MKSREFELFDPCEQIISHIQNTIFEDEVNQFSTPGAG